jgi:hypothetical protein
MRQLFRGIIKTSFFNHAKRSIVRYRNQTCFEEMISRSDQQLKNNNHGKKLNFYS